MRDRLIDVRLSEAETSIVDIEEELLRDYLGGLGLAVKYVYDAVDPGADALGPDNILVVAAGPLSGTSAPTNGRTSVATVSPLNGLMGVGNFGGSWGPRLRKAGYLALRVTGSAKTPSYVLIDDDRVELQDASHLWGKDAWETEDALKSELGDDISVLAIGQAGENLVKYACPVADYNHSPSRSNAGCVMGAKRLKAIVVRGTGEVRVADPDAFRSAVKESTQRIVDRAAGDPHDERPIGVYYEDFQRMASCGMFQSKNYQSTILPEGSDILRTRETAQQHLVLGDHFGYHCVLEKYFGCQVAADIKDGPYAGTKVGGYCYIPTWGTACQLRSYPAMFKCHELCQRYGLDAPGIPIPFAMELYERGLLTREQCDGLDLSWGNEATTLELIRKIAHREGLGDVLAEGGVHLAREIGQGAKKYSMTTKGVELMAVEPRGGNLKDTLGLMINPRGGDDALTTRGFALEEVYRATGPKEAEDEERMQYFVDSLDMTEDAKRQIFGDPLDPESLHPLNPKGKAATAAWQSKLTPLFDSLGLCLYSANYFCALGPTHYAKLLSAYRGEPVSADQLVREGERVCNLMRAFLVRAGVRREHDDIPDRFYEEPVAGGPHEGTVVSRETMQHLLGEYYRLMRWDPGTGIPTREVLTELGLVNVADQLDRLSV